MKTKISKLFVTGVVLAATLVGCSQVSQPSSASAEALNLATNPYQTLSTDPTSAKPGFPGKLAATLNLTVVQQASFKAIAAKYRPADAGDQVGALKGLLLADQVDAAALTAFMAAREAEHTAKQPQFIAMLGEFRGVLTDVQRQQLVSLVNQGPPKMGHGPFNPALMQGMIVNHLSSELSLTDVQRQSLDALATTVGTTLKAHMQAMASKKAAFIAFIQTGDASGLTLDVAPAMPVDQIVALAVSLNLTQRQRLVADMEKFRAHGGPGLMGSAS